MNGQPENILPPGTAATGEEALKLHVLSETFFLDLNKKKLHEVSERCEGEFGLGLRKS